LTTSVNHSGSTAVTAASTAAFRGDTVLHQPVHLPKLRGHLVTQEVA
jgi:hypothetical protein